MSEELHAHKDKKDGFFSKILTKIKNIFSKKEKTVKFIDEKTVERIVSTPTRVPEKVPEKVESRETAEKRMPLPAPVSRERKAEKPIEELTVDESDIQLIKLEKEKQVILDELDLIELKYKEGEITAQERDRRYVELINKLFKIKREIRSLKTKST